MIGTPVTFDGMTVRGRAVFLKFYFSKSCNLKKSFFIRAQRRRKLRSNFRRRGESSELFDFVYTHMRRS
jgi:hypothetical protein